MATLIIGAGASIAIDNSFKSGVGLLADIKKILSPYGQLRKKLISDLKIPETNIISFIKNLNSYEREAYNNHYMPSIDSFRYAIKNFPVFENVKNDYDWISKMAIMYCILQWEKKFRDKIEKGKLSFNKSWVDKIINYLITDKKTIHGTLNIVTYNYDRILEYLLNLYGYTDNSKDLVFWKRIVHVYGSININSIPFGFMPKSLIELKKPIEDFHTIHDFNIPLREKLPSNWMELTRPELANMYISNSSKNFFMGFGFDIFNCQRIGLKGAISSKFTGNIYVQDNEVFGRGMVEASRIQSFLPYMKLTYLNCNQFIDNALNESSK